MNPLTHRLLTVNIYDRLNEHINDIAGEKNSPKILSKNSLVWGSVRPDFIREDVPHFKNQGENKFYNKYNDLVGRLSVISPREFSGEMGQIFHYIGDYFCHAHNKKIFINNRRGHLMNEIRLQRFARNLGKDFFTLRFENFSFTGVKDVIRQGHQVFVGDKFSFKNDLLYSFNMCVIVGQRLIKMFLHKQKSFLAA
ncbi:MAG: zinc dependent phospholipase C family protein [bacterium]